MGEQNEGLINPREHYHGSPWPHYLFTRDQWDALKDAFPTADRLAKYVTNVPTPFSGTPVYVDECPCEASDG